MELHITSDQPDHTKRLALVIEGQQVSWIDYIETGFEIDIVDVFSLPEARRRGYITKLFHELMGKSKDLTLEVGVSNKDARSVYQRLGFASVGERKAYYRDGSDAVVMRWTAEG